MKDSTIFAISRQQVKPGDSIPIKFINPGNPLSLSSEITKSAYSPSGACYFGRIHDWSG